MCTGLFVRIGHMGLGWCCLSSCGMTPSRPYLCGVGSLDWPHGPWLVLSILMRNDALPSLSLWGWIFGLATWALVGAVYPHAE
jgi:hypothetical protein